MPKGNKENSWAEPATWCRFKPSLCDSCWATCCNGEVVEVSIPDLIRLGWVDESEVQADLESAVGPLLRRKWLRRSASPFVFLLTQKKNGDCINLDARRRCTVYDVRPEICRRFPKQGPRPGYCPYLPKVDTETRGTGKGRKTRG